MARKRRKSSFNAGELNLTAMIDVAFQLLNFFVITLKPVDVVAHLNVFRPSPQQSTDQVKPSKQIQIAIDANGIDCQGRSVSLEQLDSLLAKIGDLDPSQTILIMCTPESQHEKLVSVLDICTKSKLTNLSVVSTN